MWWLEQSKNFDESKFLQKWKYTHSKRLARVSHCWFRWIVFAANAESHTKSNTWINCRRLFRWFSFDKKWPIWFNPIANAKVEPRLHFNKFGLKGPSHNRAINLLIITLACKAFFRPKQIQRLRTDWTPADRKTPKTVTPDILGLEISF